MVNRVALDIETIPLVDDPDFSDPSHWSPFAVALGHQPSTSADIEVEVLFRSDSTAESEAKLYHNMINWIAERTGDSRELVTFNGTDYDLPILKHRSYRVPELDTRGSVVERLYLLLQTSDHVDLMQDMVDLKGYHVSLDDSLAMHGIECDEPTWNGEKITGGHMPEMGLELLSNGSNTELREKVHRYAASDVEPLFELHDRLRG